MELFVGVLIVKCHASGEVVSEVCVVQCHAIVPVVIGVHILLSLPLVQFYFSILCLDSPCCAIHPTLHPQPFFHIRPHCILTATQRRGGVTARGGGDKQPPKGSRQGREQVANLLAEGEKGANAQPEGAQCEPPKGGEGKRSDPNPTTQRNTQCGSRIRPWNPSPCWRSTQCYCVSSRK